MSTVLFVHGISVRSSSLATYLQQCEVGANSHFPDFSIKFAYWGEHFGSPYHSHLRSVPQFLDRGGQTAPNDLVNESALWSLLYRDPVFEIRLLNSQSLGESGGGLGQESPARNLQRLVTGLKLSEKTQRILVESGLGSYFDSAAKKVTESPECEEAFQRATRPLTPFRRAIARAFLAQAVLNSLQNGELPAFCLQQLLRNALHAELVEAFGGTEGALPPWIVKPFLRLGMQQATANYGSLAQENYRLVGDLLRYQSQGDAIRNAIRKEIEAAAPPILLIGHSLGGIASFETLLEDTLRGDTSRSQKIRLLATIGSQAGFFYECDALNSIRYTADSQKLRLPNGFPAWLNVFDSADLLSFLTEPFFDKASDLEISSGQPFPVAHSAYFTQDMLWNSLHERFYDGT